MGAILLFLALVLGLSLLMTHGSHPVGAAL